MTDQPLPRPIVPPTLSRFGRLHWEIPLTGYTPDLTGYIFVEHDGRLSLIGPTTISPDDAEIISKALNNASKWMATDWSPDFYDRLMDQRAGGTDD